MDHSANSVAAKVNAPQVPTKYLSAASAPSGKRCRFLCQVCNVIVKMTPEQYRQHKLEHLTNGSVPQNQTNAAEASRSQSQPPAAVALSSSSDETQQTQPAGAQAPPNSISIGQSSNVPVTSTPQGNGTSQIQQPDEAMLPSKKQKITSTPQQCNLQTADRNVPQTASTFEGVPANGAVSSSSHSHIIMQNPGLNRLLGPATNSCQQTTTVRPPPVSTNRMSAPNSATRPPVTLAQPNQASNEPPLPALVSQSPSTTTPSPLHPPTSQAQLVRAPIAIIPPMAISQENSTRHENAPVLAPPSATPLPANNAQSLATFTISPLVRTTTPTTIARQTNAVQIQSQNGQPIVNGTTARAAVPCPQPTSSTSTGIRSQPTNVQPNTVSAAALAQNGEPTGTPAQVRRTSQNIVATPLASTSTGSARPNSALNDPSLPPATAPAVSRSLATSASAEPTPTRPELLVAVVQPANRGSRMSSAEESASSHRQSTSQTSSEPSSTVAAAGESANRSQNIEVINLDDEDDDEPVLQYQAPNQVRVNQPLNEVKWRCLVCRWKSICFRKIRDHVNLVHPGQKNIVVRETTVRQRPVKKRRASGPIDVVELD